MGEMRLPDFIKRAMAFFEKAEAKLEILEKKADDPDGDGNSCDACAGSGKCDACEGSGRMDGANCADCEGSGKCAECEGKGTAAAQLATVKRALETVQGLLSTATKLNVERAGEISKLTEQLAAEKRRANEVLASQGLPPGQVPGTDAKPPGGGQAENHWANYQNLLASSPREAGLYWQKHADAILAARPKE